MRCHKILAQVAREHAEDMAARDYFNPVNPDGFGPNYLVEQAGYELPDWYSQALDANNIESIAAGYTTPEAAWNGWLASPGHRTHVLGEDSDFFADQTNYGIGYAFAPGSQYTHYLVFISAPPAVGRTANTRRKGQTVRCKNAARSTGATGTGGPAPSTARVNS